MRPGAGPRLSARPYPAALDESTDDTRLLDTTPNSSKGFLDANLVAGKSFFDAAHNITIKNLSEPASGAAQIEVCIGSCPQPLVGVLSGKVDVLGTSLPDHVSALQVNATTIDISTFGRPIRLAGGCVLLAPDRARCTASGSYLAGYGGDDLLEAGGSMANTLDGGPGNDLLRGGYGPDMFVGGAGVDTVDDALRFGQPITGTPGTGADDGHPGEGDNITGDVEKVLYPLW
ncbi:MAG TPA: hypothetical protein VL856_14375 [Acidimicrobiia bacterium]|jgi:hypothetical protein|nr:hypothetical protein [Acidimicrobiia bacterium]